MKTRNINVKDGQMFVNTAQDCEWAVNLCKNYRYNPKAEARLVAHIPDVAILAYMTKHKLSYDDVIHNDEHIDRILKNPNLSYFTAK